MNERGHASIPVILGGAALTRTYVERDLRQVYEGRLFYGKDAFEGLHTMDRLMELKRSGETDVDFGRALGGRNLPPRMSERAATAVAVDVPPRSPQVETDNPIFVPPFLGSRVDKGISLAEMSKYVNETGLFRTQWGYRPESGESDFDFKTRIRPTFRDELGKAQASGILLPAVAYGYFAANSEGNDLIIWKDETRTAEWLRFSFPRQQIEPYLCIADFFRPAESGELDYAAFHIVTMGRAVSEAAAVLFAENRYTEYLHLHGLGVELTEALAEYWHRRIREELGFADEDGPSLAGLFRQQYRGGRYSWGYPACPDLEDNAKCAELLGADRIGVEVNEESSWQFHPEQTTAALICHHPKAKYFVAGKAR
jgi:5-methyltetrahydrofolate--homocysteine methyltransferase